MLEEQAQQERSEPLWPKLQATTQGTCMHQLLLYGMHQAPVWHASGSCSMQM